MKSNHHGSFLPRFESVSPASRDRAFAILVDAATALLCARDLNELSITLCKKMTELADSSACRISLLEEDCNCLTAVAYHARFDDTGNAMIGQSLELAQLPWHQRALTTRQSIVLFHGDPPTEISETEALFFHSQRDGCSLLIPLIAHDRGLGVVALTEAKPWQGSHFSSDTVEFCRLLAAQGALAIYNRQSIERAQCQGQSTRQTLNPMPDMDLVSFFSHELRAPLTNIGLAAELLARPDLEADVKQETLETLTHYSARLMRMANDVLESSRLEQGRVQQTLEPLALVPLVRQTVGVLQRQHRDYVFKIDAKEGLPFAMGDLVSVEIVLENLIQNAIHYSPRGSTITISLREKDGHVEVQVRDQGQGIPADQLERIFLRFHRVPDKNTRRRNGFGLGLYISKMLVEAQGGVIRAESKPGNGSSLYFGLKKANNP
jgi:signal transduction histidine kinase